MEYNICSEDNKYDLLKRAITNDILTTIKELIEVYKCNVFNIADYNLTYFDMITFMDTDVVKYFIENNYDITKSKRYSLKVYCKNTNLCIYLIKHNILEVDKYLIIDVINNRNNELLTYILNNYHIKLNNKMYASYAILSEDIDIVKTVIDNGCVINKSLLYSACNNRLWDIAKYLIKKCTFLINNDLLEIINYESRKNNDKSFLKYVYNHRLFNNGYGLLYASCQLGYVDIIKKLMKAYNYDINKPDKYNIRPINYALLSNVECVEYLLTELNADPKYISMYNIFGSGNIEIIDKYINAGAIPTENYNRLLESVIDSGNIEIIKYITKYNIQPTQSSLDYAIYVNKFDIFKYIIENIGIKKTTMDTLISYGFYNNCDVIKYIINKYNLTTKDYYILLSELVIHDDNIDIVKFVVDKIGKDILTKDIDDKTLYTIAANYGAYKICEYIKNTQ